MKKKKIVDCTIKELSEYCKNHNKGNNFTDCRGCKLNATSRYCLVGWPIGLVKGLKSKTIEVDDEKENR